MSRDGDGSSGTSVSLLELLAGDGRSNPRAWGVFVDRYGRLVYRWCRRWGATDGDAHDAIQETLLTFMRQASEFRYDPTGSFRAWLKTIAYRCWLRIVERAHRTRMGMDGPMDDPWPSLASTPARDDLVRSLEGWARREVLELALLQVRRRVDPATWEAFRLAAFEEKSGGEVAEVLNLSPGAVYLAGFRVGKMLRVELTRLDPDG